MTKKELKEHLELLRKQTEIFLTTLVTELPEETENNYRSGYLEGMRNAALIVAATLAESFKGESVEAEMEFYENAFKNPLLFRNDKDPVSVERRKALLAAAAAQNKKSC